MELKSTLSGRNPVYPRVGAVKLIHPLDEFSCDEVGMFFIWIAVMDQQVIVSGVPAIGNRMNPQA